MLPTRRAIQSTLTNGLGAGLVLVTLEPKLPEALVPVFPRLRECLDDPDPAVVACTVNVLTELATDNPKGYLGLAPVRTCARDRLRFLSCGPSSDTLSLCQWYPPSPLHCYPTNGVPPK